MIKLKKIILDNNLFFSCKSTKEYVLKGLKKLPYNLSEYLLCERDPARIFSVLKFSDFLNNHYEKPSNKKINVALVSGKNLKAEGSERLGRLPIGPMFLRLFVPAVKR